ncbi:MAG: hypothetical protein RIS35_3349, partial [Pseudomonadota bacterium]
MIGAFVANAHGLQRSAPGEGE